MSEYKANMKRIFTVCVWWGVHLSLIFSLSSPFSLSFSRPLFPSLPPEAMIQTLMFMLIVSERWWRWCLLWPLLTLGFSGKEGRWCRWLWWIMVMVWERLPGGRGMLMVTCSDVMVSCDDGLVNYWGCKMWSVVYDGVCSGGVINEGQWRLMVKIIIGDIMETYIEGKYK